MANIKPAEVSKILRQQLEGIQTGVELEEVGLCLRLVMGSPVSTDFKCRIE